MGASSQPERCTQLASNAPGEGGWYSQFTPEPIEVIEAWGLPHHEASILQYIVRHKQKNGLEDLFKAKWYLDRLIALAYEEKYKPTEPLDTAEGFLADVRAGRKSSD